MTDQKKPSLLDSIRAKQAAKPATPAPAQPSPSKPVFPNLLAKSNPVVQQQNAVVETPKPQTPAAPPKPGLLAAAAAKGVEKKQAQDQDYQYLFTEMPTDVKELCARFDEMMVRDGGINLLNIDLGRAYVKKIMVILKENPEFEGMIIDRDVHNIMKFIRATREQAIDTINVKAEKAVKAASRKAAKTGRFGSIEAIDFGAAGGTTLDLEALRDVEF